MTKGSIQLIGTIIGFAVIIILETGIFNRNTNDECVAKQQTKGGNTND